MGRRGIWGGLLGMVVGMVLAAPAPARADATVSCTLQANIDAGIKWIGGSGTYLLEEVQSLCKVLVPGVSDPATAVLDIWSDGTYTNVECGTGVFQDDDPYVVATITFIADPSAAPAAKAAIESADWSYSISFVNTRGIWTWRNEHWRQDVSPLVPGVGGVFAIAPWAPSGNPVTEPDGLCSDGYPITGELGFQT